MRYLLYTLLIVICSSFNFKPDWGFYGHRKINRMAVFTLPQELFGFYKKNIEYITAHAVDPDKRRYALKNEFARHYIDIDHWDTIPFNNVPRDFALATMKFGQLIAYNKNDTLQIKIEEQNHKDFFYNYLFEDRYSTKIELDIDSLISFHSTEILTKKYTGLYFNNALVQYGILPYFLEDFYKRLVWAFEKKDTRAILKISADIGHYISDGHVPLHTTENYNGQMTDQIGIHAFWESRLPELFADDNYDFVVGKAEYIDDMKSYIWNFITESHELLPAVLELEYKLKSTYAEDEQFCFEERLERTTRIQCEEYSAAYHNSLDGMVEKRMQDAVLAVGSFWYSAWVEAGQPDLYISDKVVNEEDELEEKKLNEAFQNGEQYGRKH